MIRKLFLIFVGMLLLCGCASATAISDTTITELTTWTDNTYEIDGNLTIGTGGTLILDNTSLLFQNSVANEHVTKIYGNGNLTLINNSVFGTDDMATGTKIYVNNTGIIVARDSTFKGLYRDAVNSYSAIQFWVSTPNPVFYNVTFKDSNTSVGFYHTNSLVENCIFDNVARTCISQNSHVMIVKNCTFRNCPDYINAIAPSYIESGLIENCLLENMADAHSYGIDTMSGDNNYIIRNNEVRNVTRAIVAINDEVNVTIENNYVHDKLSDGLAIATSYNVSDFVIRGNRIDRVGEGFITTGHGATGYNITNFTVYNNTFMNMGSFGPAFSVQMRNSTVYDNIFHATGSTKAALKTLNDTSKPDGKMKNVIFRNNTFDGFNYGLELHSGDNVTFADCYINNSTTYDIFFTGADNDNHKFINTRFNQSKVFIDNSEDIFATYYYPNMVVKNVAGQPIKGAVITANTTVLNGNGDIQTSFETDANGKLYDSGNTSNHLAIPENSTQNAVTTSYISELTASKYALTDSEIVDPDNTWYSSNLESLAGSEIVLTLDTSATIPVAEFTANATSGTSPVEIAFTDSSTNTPTSWLWDFGDGYTSTEQNPVHNYTTAGTFDVTLTAYNDDGYDSELKENEITVSSNINPNTWSELWYWIQSFRWW